MGGYTPIMPWHSTKREFNVQRNGYTFWKMYNNRGYPEHLTSVLQNIYRKLLIKTRSEISRKIDINQR